IAAAKNLGSSICRDGDSPPSDAFLIESCWKNAGGGRRGQPVPPEIEFEPAIGLLVSSGRAESPRDAIVGKQVTPGRRRASERFEANRRQSVQEPSPTAGDRRCDDE